ncbi:transposase [[Flexibacter] sp. ATCC 35208]|uniref:transposase n=1 Tax=[Flexibacter] sp. ATCC 35208 TaxID=1936242 RepID=UPI0011811D5E
MPLEVPIDRDVSIQPKLVPKRSRVMLEIEDNILSFYNHGMTVHDIETHAGVTIWRRNE